MTRAWLLLHLLGFSMWIGGALAVMVAGVAGRRESRTALGAIVRAQSLVYRVIIAPGALVTVLAGILLTFRNSGVRFPGADLWLIIMQGGGILGRLDPEGKTGPYFDELRARQKLVGTIAGVLALVALVAGMMVAHGA